MCDGIEGFRVCAGFTVPAVVLARWSWVESNYIIMQVGVQATMALEGLGPAGQSYYHHQSFCF